MLLLAGLALAGCQRAEHDTATLGGAAREPGLPQRDLLRPGERHVGLRQARRGPPVGRGMPSGSYSRAWGSPPYFPHSNRQGV